MHSSPYEEASSTSIPIHIGSALDDATALHPPSPKATEGNETKASPATSTPSDPQPFLKQRRLPSILLDSWEFRKLASEGSVLANAMVSYDVDDDGVEEVIVGTTEGLLCVVKPDCRAPLFLRVLAATISVVLYTPIQHRLVLITLEGQCEVIDHFLSPDRQQQQPRGRTRTPSSTAESGGFQRTESTSSFTRGQSNSHNSHHTNAMNPLGSTPGSTASASTSPSATVHHRSHTSVTNPMLAEVANQPATPPTHVFHVPSNCLCADLSSEADADLVFLGSYDRRFYVYSIATGSCLLSVFVHDPITSVKAFTIPTAGAQGRRAATSSSFISVYDNSGGRHAAKRTSSKTTGASSITSTQTAEYRTPGPQSHLYVPLVFIATPTHLILLPAGLNELQQWRKLQPKSAHLPLTLQLHGDAPTQRQQQQQAPPHEQQQAAQTPSPAASPQSTFADGVQKRQLSSSGSGMSFHPNSVSGGGAGSGGVLRSSTPSLAMHHAADTLGGRENGGPARRVLRGSSAPREGETAVPPPPSQGSNRNGNVRATDTFASGGGSWIRSGQQERLLSGEVDATRNTSNSGGGGGIHETRGTNVVTPSASEQCGGMRAEMVGTQLTTSQQRRQARKRAIQAAEMGRPVLVKPLWALHLGQHTLDVPPLQAAPAPPEVAAAAATTLSDSIGEAATTTGRKRSQASAGPVSSTHEHHGSLSAASERRVRHGSHRHRTIPRGDSTSLFSISSPSSVSGLRENSDVFAERASTAQSGGGSAGRGLLQRVSVRSSRDGGEETEAVSVSNTLRPASVLGLATLEHSGSGQGLQPQWARRPPRLQAVQADSVNGSGSSEQGSPDHEVGRGSSNSSRRSGSDEDIEDGNVVEGSARTRRVARARRSSEMTKEPSEGVRFSLPARDHVRTTIQNEDEEEKEEDALVDNGDYRSTSTSSDGDSSVTDSTSDSTGADHDTSAEASRDSDDSASESSDGRDRQRRGGKKPSLGGKGVKTSVDPSMLARSLARMRAESVPTTLLRRRLAADTATTGPTASGLLRQGHTMEKHSHTGSGAMAASGTHTSLMDLAKLDDQHGLGRRRHGRRSGSAERTHHHHYPSSSRSPGDHPHERGAAVTATGSEGGDVRLPTSVDVSVGASQVAVALSCEDGLAFELRFTVAKLSSLSRRARHRTGRTVRLYDLRHPPCPWQLLGRKRKMCGDGTEENASTWGRPSLLQKPASSPSSPAQARTFSKAEAFARRHTHRKKSTHRHTSIIYLPQPTPGPLLGASTSSPLPSSQSATTAAAAGSFDTASVASAVKQLNSVSLMGAQHNGNTPLTTTNNDVAGRRRSQTSLQLPQHLSALRPPTPTSPLANGSVAASSRSRRHEEDAVVLRVQCLWAARIGDSPLVQRARVFCVRDVQQDNTFCTVLVAANGTCYAIDGDTLSVVECSVKEDCSSFTLMAGPSSTMPFLPASASAVEDDTGGDGAGGTKEGTTPSTRTGVNANLLRGAVGRTVSCVCVSVDELCIYSVGEANQLVQHRDAPHVSPTAVASEVTEPTSLLSRRLPNNPCSMTAPAAAQQALDGEVAYVSSPLRQLHGGRYMDSSDAFPDAIESEEAALLRLLAQRLREGERHRAVHEKPDGAEDAAETEEAMLLRVKRLLLHGYSEAEWEKLKWMDLGVT